MGMVLAAAAMLVGAMISRSVNKVELFSQNIIEGDDDKDAVRIKCHDCDQHSSKAAFRDCLELF